MLFICYFVICCFFGLYEMNLIENFCVLMNYIIKIIKKKVRKVFGIFKFDWFFVFSRVVSDFENFF